MQALAIAESTSMLAGPVAVIHLLGGLWPSTAILAPLKLLEAKWLWMRLYAMISIQNNSVGRIINVRADLLSLIPNWFLVCS